MKKKNKKYNPFDFASAIFMILALLWLTVSTPFVYASQQKLQEASKMMQTSLGEDCNEEEASNPLTNTTEEKNPNSSGSFSEEYLHHQHEFDYYFSVASQYHKSENDGTYIAFHGELLVPPPDAVS
ncbi:MAG TPA: hypothetical protein VM888_04815 [Chitinophagaceae bacterium]|jgi:hypothetical protein|nr:hypothetical protein [Chitinophagaceae bacterium]